VLSGRGARRIPRQTSTTPSCWPPGRGEHHRRDAQDRRPPADRGVRPPRRSSLRTRTSPGSPGRSSRESSPGPSPTCARWSGWSRTATWTGRWSAPARLVSDPGKGEYPGAGPAFPPPGGGKIARADVAPLHRQPRLTSASYIRECPAPSPTDSRAPTGFCPQAFPGHRRPKGKKRYGEQEPPAPVRPKKDFKKPRTATWTVVAEWSRR